MSKSYEEKVIKSSISKRKKKKARDYKQDARLKIEFWKDRAQKHYTRYQELTIQTMEMQEAMNLFIAQVVAASGEKIRETPRGKVLGYKVMLPYEQKRFTLEIADTGEGICLLAKPKEE